MPLHLVGETIDKARSHALSKTGCLLQLMRGVYVDAGDDVEATVIRHAVRIAKYLYPNAYLSAASAVLLGPTRDGRLFLSARRVQRTRLRSLEIIQTVAPPQPSIVEAIVDNGRDRMALKINGKDDRLRRADIKAFAATAGLRARNAEAAIDGLLGDLANGLNHLRAACLRKRASCGRDTIDHKIVVPYSSACQP